MLAQVTDIPKFIMADSEDEFMPICIAASTAFVANNPKHLPADVERASARRTTPGRCHDFWNSHNRCPADTPRRHTMTGRCKIGRPAGLVSSRLEGTFDKIDIGRLCR